MKKALSLYKFRITLNNPGNWIILGLMVLLNISCEEVVQVDLEENTPRLVIDASLEKYKNSEKSTQTILLSKTTGFYEEPIVPVEDADINVSDAQGNVYKFKHANSGLYINSSINLILNEEYKLEVNYKDEVYTATEKMMPVTEIDTVEQLDTGGFTGDEIEIKVFYEDPADEVNYYVFTFTNEKTKLEIYNDEFSNGNRIFGYYSNEDIKVNDTINIEMGGISKPYYEYLFILRSQVGSGGGPFETQPATVKGNIVNQTNADNFPFGYFQLSQVDSTSYIVK